MKEVLLIVLIFSVPLVAIVGAIVAGIVKSIGRQRLIELAQRERIAAIERGIPPEKLPPLPILPALAEGGFPFGGLPFVQAQLRRSQGLFVSGLVCIAAGLAMLVFTRFIHDANEIWPISLFPLFVGIALMISSLVVKPRSEDWKSGASLGE
jgi:hypothetical protein